jgi:hypothetical protein
MPGCGLAHQALLLKIGTTLHSGWLLAPLLLQLPCAFSDVGHAAANLGKLGEFKKDLGHGIVDSDDDDAATTRTLEDPDTTPKTPTKSEADGSSKKDKESASEKKVWFNRDDKICTELSKHKTWETTIRGDLIAAKTRLAKVRETVTPEVKDDVQAELRLLNNRLSAIKLVLMENLKCGDHLESLAKVKAEPVEPAPTATNGGAARGAAEEAAESAAVEAPVLGAAAEDVKDKGEEQSTPTAMGVASTAELAEVVGDDVEKASLKSLSTVTKFVSKSGGDPIKALKKYIASFGDDSACKELGGQQPCRSYRSLKCLSEFGDMEVQLKASQSKVDITAINAKFKPFKSALNDLMTMAKAAANRAEKAIGDAKARADTAKKLDAQAFAPEADRSKRRKTKLVEGPAKLLDVMHTCGTEVASMNVNADLTLAGDIDASKPVIFRLPSDYITAHRMKTEVDSLAVKFSGSAERVENGRGQRRVSAEGEAETVKVFEARREFGCPRLPNN